MHDTAVPQLRSQAPDQSNNRLDQDRPISSQETNKTNKAEDQQKTQQNKTNKNKQTNRKKLLITGATVRQAKTNGNLSLQRLPRGGSKALGPTAGSNENRKGISQAEKSRFNCKLPFREVLLVAWAEAANFNDASQILQVRCM